MSAYCYNCMSLVEQETVCCPRCGKQTTITAPAHQLKPGTLLRDRYLIGKALGQGGFGITYIGLDTTLNLRVAIKEYYPNGISTRNHEITDDVTLTSSSIELYQKGKLRFLQEARTLARFYEEPGIVSVHDFFEANNTAYIVMEYLDGITLKRFVETRGPIPADSLNRAMRPIMQSLGQVHEQGVIHRDISPDNIMVLRNGSLKLLDFGAAREVGGDKSLSVMLKPGYAPYEQYRSDGKQGPWTDIYALCATMYFCLTGIKPDEAPKRMENDELLRPSELGANVSPAQESVLLRGMSVRAKERFQTLRELSSALYKKEEPQNYIANQKKAQEKTSNSIHVDQKKSNMSESKTSAQEKGEETLFGSDDKRKTAEIIRKAGEKDFDRDSDDALETLITTDEKGRHWDNRKRLMRFAGGLLLTAILIFALWQFKQKSKLFTILPESTLTVLEPTVEPTPELTVEPTPEPTAEPIPTAEQILAPEGDMLYTGRSLDGLNYEVYTNCAVVISYYGNATRFDIPEILDGKPVISIAPGAFSQNKTLSSLTIPEGITSIGSSALYNCASLESITLPNSLRSIGDSACYGCVALTSLKIPEGVTDIGEKAFFKCEALESITLPKSLKSIGNYACYGCIALTSVTIPEYVTDIGESAFSNCNALENVVLPNSLTTIGKDAFYNCSALRAIAIPEGVTGINEGAFYKCEALNSVALPDSLTTIGADAFYNCSLLTSLTIPDGVNSIGKSVFNGCTALESVALPKNLKKLEERVFCGCTALTSLTIPEGVTSIGPSAMYDCTALEHVTLPDSLKTIEGDYAFGNCSALRSVTIPEGVTIIGKGTFVNCLGLKSIILPEGVTSISDSAFSHCEALESIILPSSLKRIEENAFNFCLSLTDITLPEGLTGIDRSAFNRCTSLRNIIIPDTVLSIGHSAFDACTLLTDITIPDSVINIGVNVFNGSHPTIHTKKGSLAEKTFANVYHVVCDIE